MTVECKAVQFDRLGDPRETLALRTIQVDTRLNADEVLVQWMASPVNPADINIARGVYFYVRKPTNCLGIDGFGIVQKVGENVTDLEVGDHVMPLHPHKQGGYWRELHVIRADGLHRLDKRLPLEVKATFSANTATAYLMLKLFVKLEPGEYVLQNAANSQVGRNIIELAKALGWKTINLVRNRANVADLKQELKHLGGDFVFTEGEFKQCGREFVQGLGRPLRLSINGVGGKSSILCSANLAKFGTMLVYGGMSLKPHEILTSSLVFKSIKVVGFQLFDYFQEHQTPFRRQVYKEIEKLHLDGKIHASPMEKVPLANFKQAVEKTMSGSHLKQLLIISDDEKCKL